MPTTAEIRAEFGVPLEEFLSFMSDPDMYSSLNQHQAGMKREIGESVQNGPIRSWEVGISMREQLPAFARALVPSEDMRWVQKFQLDTQTLDMTFQIMHPLPASLLEVHGVGRIRADGPDRTRFDIDVFFTSGLPLVGRRIEALAAERTRPKLEDDMAFRRAYMESHRGKARPLEKPEEGGGS